MLIPLGDQVIVEESKLTASGLVLPDNTSGLWRGTVKAKSSGISPEGKEILELLELGTVVAVHPSAKRTPVGDDCYLVDLHQLLGRYTEDPEESLKGKEGELDLKA